MLDGLERQGCRAPPVDRGPAHVEVQLTARGRRLLNRKRKLVDEKRRAVFESLDAADRESAARLLRTLAAAIEEPLVTPPRQHYNLTLGVLVLSALAYALSQTMVAPALPAIQNDLGTSTTTVTFVLTAYLLTASVAHPDHRPPRRHVRQGADAAGDADLLRRRLVGLRALALDRPPDRRPGDPGRRGGGLPARLRDHPRRVRSAFGIIQESSRPERVATGIGLISATFGIGGGAGLVLSGLIVDHLAYEWIFWLSLVFVGIAIVATHLFVPESPIKSPAKIDWVGAALLSVGLAALLIGVSEGTDWGWTDPRIIGLFSGAADRARGLGALGAARAAAARRHEDDGRARRLDHEPHRTARRLRDVRLVHPHPPLRAGRPGVSGFGFAASVTEAGVFLLPSALVMLFAGPMSGWLGTKYGSRLPMLLGTAICTASFVLIAAAHAERWEIYPRPP